jgi:hypothetical protein
LQGQEEGDHKNIIAISISVCPNATELNGSVWRPAALK